MSIDTILNYFPSISDKQKDLFAELGCIYSYWNSRINLISRKDMDKFYLHHVLHSLSLAKIVELNSSARVLDVGTGGGFPGIPMAILFSESDFHLIDSIGKKINVVSSIANQLGLNNVQCSQIRVENVCDKYDFVLGRAVTNVDVFYRWTKKNVSSTHKHSIKNGILYMKGPELVQSQVRYLQYNVSDFFDSEYFFKKKVLHIY